MEKSIKPEVLFAISDTDLITEAKRGKQDAFRCLVERHQQRVRNTVLGMLGDTSEADDVAQEVFIRFYKSMKNFRADAQLSTYLTRIAINLCLNELKRRKKKQGKIISLFWKAAGQEDLARQPLQVADKSADLSRYDLQEGIEYALQRLPVEFRTVVILRLIEGYSVQETADILGIPQGTVASRLARAQLKLKEILTDNE